MGLEQPKLLILLSHLAILLASVAAELPPAAAPSHHHHHKQHRPLPLPKPHPSPSYAPAKPPVQPPVKPPTKPPVQPPVKPPTKPPVQPPTKPPVHPPVKPPTKPPVQPPTKAPAYPPVKPNKRRPLSVQGVVFCKNCSYSGNDDTLLGSKPLPGATAVLKCRTMKTVLTKNGTTDKNGYFFIEAPKGVISHKAIKYCHVYLVSPPSGAPCSQISNMNGGRSGGLLKPQETIAPLPYDLFTVGPFAFKTPKAHCRHRTSVELV